MNQPTVSVLTTVYNRSKYLAACIESVQQSKFQDYEHIIVDDCSTDDSVAIAKKYSNADTRIKVFENNTNLGDYPNRNQAAQYATGKYLKYLDADDMHSPWALDIMVSAMEDFPSAGLGIFEYTELNPFKPTYLSPANSFVAYYTKNRYFFDASPLNVIIKTDAFHSVGGFSGKRMVGDFELWHLIGRTSGVLMIPSNPLFYRVHENQEMTVHAKDPIWGFRYLLISQGHLMDAKNPMSPEDRTKHLIVIEKKIGRTIIIAIQKHGFHKANEMRNEAQWRWTKVFKAAFS